MNQTYTRIVGAHETLDAVMLEAINHGCFVFSDCIHNRSVISRLPPNRHFEKVCASFRREFDFEPEAA